MDDKRYNITTTGLGIWGKAVLSKPSLPHWTVSNKSSNLRYAEPVENTLSNIIDSDAYKAVVVRVPNQTTLRTYVTDDERVDMKTKGYEEEWWRDSHQTRERDLAYAASSSMMKQYDTTE